MAEAQRIDGFVYPTVQRLPESMAKMPPGCAPELAAISGLPAITLPCGVSRIGPPVGMEMLSVQEDEAALMVLALACEGRWARRDRYKKPAGLVPCGLSVLHRTYPYHYLVGWRPCAFNYSVLIFNIFV